jgi:hypothetical protein
MYGGYNMRFASRAEMKKMLVQLKEKKEATAGIFGPKVQNLLFLQ